MSRTIREIPPKVKLCNTDYVLRVRRGQTRFSICDQAQSGRLHNYCTVDGGAARAQIKRRAKKAIRRFLNDSRNW